MKTKLYTIGFTGKSAETFFELLIKAGVTKIIDTRINNVSQLAGFAKGSDLKYFCRQIGNIDYEHNVDYAPTKELLSAYRDKEITWPEYEVKYLSLLKERDILSTTKVKSLHQACLLCSEHEPDQCHRKLLADYLQKAHTSLEIIHLM